MREELPTTQAVELVERAERVLVVGPSKVSGDSIGSMLGLALALKSLGKEVTLLTSSSLPSELNFLPKREHLTDKLDGARDLLIEIDIGRTDVDTLSYDVEGEKLVVNVSPSRGSLHSKDIVTKQGPHKYDLIVVLDSASVGRIDSIYEEESELFHSAPVLNIDHKKQNELYGTVNLVDGSSSSTSETAAFFLKELGVSFSNEIATALLTGIISATHALRSPETKPSTLKLAAELIEAGASKEKIVESLYKAKPLSAIKLWGRVLARLEAGNDRSYVYSSVSFDDFKDCGATPKQARGLMDELVSVSRAGLFILFLEFEKNQVSVRLRSPLSERAGEIAARFRGDGGVYNSRFLIKDTPLAEVILRVLSAVEGKNEKSEQEPSSDYDEDFYPDIPPPSYLKPKEGILTWRPDDKHPTH